MRRGAVASLSLLPLLLAFALAAPGCRREREADDVDRLRALGYVDAAPEELRDDPARVGVVRHDPARTQPGYDLYGEQYAAAAILMDADGRVLHRFEDPTGVYWARAELLPDGDLVVVGAQEREGRRKEVPPDARYAARIGWDGTLRWKRFLGAHHDVSPLPDGRLLTLEMHDRPIPEVNPSVPVRDDRIALLSPDGELLAAHSLYDLLSAGPFPFAFQDVRPRLEALAREPSRRRRPAASARDYVDLLHSNAVEPYPGPPRAAGPPIYRPDSVLVTIRHQDRIAVIGLDDLRLRWAWGEGELAGPHDASWLDDGHILVFDNGLGRRFSRVVEVDPASGAIVWEYRAAEPGTFYSASRGSAQRLANGNTLVTNSEAGQAFEVTRDGEVVWEYWNPVFNSRGRRALIGRMRRLDAGLVEGLLARFGADRAAPARDRR